MKSPFIKFYNKKTSNDLSQFIESFSYEDSDDKDAYAEFRINGLAKNERNEYLMNDLELSKDTDLIFQFGFIGGFTSPMHQITIHENKIEYNQGRAVVFLRCLDKGNVIKRIRTNVQWRNVTASDIAQQIADKYGMSARIDKTDRIYKSICQSGLSDYQLLHKLAHESGALNCYVSNNTLVFEKINFSKKSKRILTVGDNVIRFSTTVSNSNSVGTAHKGVTASGVDIMSGKPFTYSYILDGIGGQILGKYSTEPTPKDKRISNGVLDAAFKELNTDKSQHFDDKLQANNILNINADARNAVTDIIGTVKIGAQTPGEAKAKAESLVSKAKKNSVTGTVELELDSSFRIGDIVTIDGLIADRDKGNWYVKEIRHSIKPNAYASTELQLSRNAINAGTTPAAHGAVNNSVGKKDATPTTDIRLDGVTGDLYIHTAAEKVLEKYRTKLIKQKGGSSAEDILDDFFNTKH